MEAEDKYFKDRKLIQSKPQDFVRYTVSLWHKSHRNKSQLKSLMIE